MSIRRRFCRVHGLAGLALIFAFVVSSVGALGFLATERSVLASAQVPPTVTLSTDAVGAQPSLTFEYKLAQNSPANLFYLNRPSTYPAFTPVSGATFAGIITLWINGVQRPVADFLNPNAIWAGGIQIWVKSGVTIAAGTTVKLQFNAGYVTNPSVNGTHTWNWRTALGSGAAVETFSTTSTTTGAVTTTTSTTSTTTTTTIPADTTAPTLSSRTPADNATGVSRTANLVMTFSENVSAVAGKSVTVMDASTNNAVETISVTNTSLVTVSGSIVTVNPATTLAYETNYFVRVDAGAFRDAAGNAFAGIWDSGAWNFATAQAPDSTAPTLTTSSPADGATGVSRTADVELTFSENVTAVAGKDISILKFTDSSVVETIAANDSSRVTIAGNRVTVNRSVTLGYSTVYFVRVDTGAFRDAAGNAYAGLWTNTELNFTTEAAPVTSTTSTTVPGSPATTQPAASGGSPTTTNMAITSNSASTVPSGATASTAPAGGVSQTTSTVVGLVNGAAVTSTTRSVARDATTETTAGSTTTTTTPAVPETVGAFSDPETGEMVAYLNGKPVEIESKAIGSSVVASVGQVSMTVSIQRADGESALPNPDGSMPMRAGDTVRVNVAGLTPESDAEVWVFSEPTLLGRTVADGVGSLAFEASVPDIEPGNHHVVLEGRSRDDADVSLGVKLLALESTGTSVVQRVGTALVWTLLIVGVLAGLFLPNTLRRRRREI